MNNLFIPRQTTLSYLEATLSIIRFASTKTINNKGDNEVSAAKHGASTRGRKLMKVDGAVPSRGTLTYLDQEAEQIQTLFRKKQLDPRDQFGSLSRIKLNQPEPVQKGFQPDIWDQGVEMFRVVKDREKTFREKLEDEFSEGRAVQITQPLHVTVKHTLRKAETLNKWRAAKQIAIKQRVPIPPSPKVMYGIQAANKSKQIKRGSNTAQGLTKTNSTTVSTKTILDKKGSKIITVKAQEKMHEQ